jgi:poly-gamma-glutamate synthesis protein (capsule biosynthesis protein)
MTGRGIDQVMANPCESILHEEYVYSAIDYVRLAEDAHGPIPRGVNPSYVWGDAVAMLDHAAPDLRVVNLETSITRSNDFEPKGINYRMSPENASCLTAAGIDCCVLANNHVLDWGRVGLRDTLAVLKRMQIQTSGAGSDYGEAAAPAAFDLFGKGRVLVFSYALPTSGTPWNWAATPTSPGVNLLSELTDDSASAVCRDIVGVRRPDDIVVVSLHWGPNWGYDIPEGQRHFAHRLVDEADVSIVHGHSSHHAKSIEVYRNRLILYGCGDFLNDYEGIRGYEAYRDDLAVMYFVDIDAASGHLDHLALVPLQIRQFRLIHPSEADIDWMRETLDRESRQFGARVTTASDKHLALTWNGTR